MRDNPLQFAVVREDPHVELAVLDRARSRPRRALLVASGGCTALTLLQRCPDLEVVAIDPNPAQLDWVRSKLDVLESDLPRPARLARFGVENPAADALSHAGNFESLFRGLAGLITELVANPAEIEAWLRPVDRDLDGARRAFASPYWAAAFEMFFSAALLEAMFTQAATQHAPPGSYPGYFRQRIEAGILAADAPYNRFLHHVLLGRYLDRPGALPPFLTAPWPADARRRLELRSIDLAGVASFRDFDLIDLSNVLDWTDAARGRQLLTRIGHEASPGATVLWRQLNNATDRRPWCGDRLRFDAARDAELTAVERSLFYASVHCGVVMPDR